MNTFEKDVCEAAMSPCVPWGKFAKRTIAVTGATGLVGKFFVATLLQRNDLFDDGVKLVLLVRDLRRAEEIFGSRADIVYMHWDALEASVPQGIACDYIVHCASITASRLMVERPVETIDTTIRGSRAMLELAWSTNARLCYVSSMEVYGSGSKDMLSEECGGALDAMSVRSSYPQSKQLVETLCASFASEYGVHASVVRLAQTFGAGIPEDDNRVFAQFARSCLEGSDIELLTDGSKRNMYVGTGDAVTAILTVLAIGEAGQAYNVANEETFSSIYEMACMAAHAFGDSIQVKRMVDNTAAQRFAVGGTIRMDTAKIRALGWRPTLGLNDMYAHMIADWEDR